jgi:tetratricopeptide (TPR) repeat protein
MNSTNYVAMQSLLKYVMPVLVKFCLIILLSISDVNPVLASDVERLLEKADGQMEQMNEEGALDTYLEVLKLEPNQYEALWNASLLYAAIGYRYENDDKKKEYFNRAVELAEKSIDNFPEKGYPYYVMAVAKGRMTDVVGSRSRIRLAHAVEENVKKAVEIMPEHALSWHLYGVWHSEVANAGRAERFVARFISRGLPEGSVQKAEEYLHKAKELDPENILIRLDLARHYERNGQRLKAIDVLEELLSLGLEPQTKDGPDHLEDARELLNKLG